MIKVKKVKVDMNPKRVQNPYEQYKRSPGKFDQKVYMEQENFSNQAIREMGKVHSMQMNAMYSTLRKDIAYIKRKKEKIEAKSVDYNYLKQLRQAIIDENRRRVSVAEKIEEFARSIAQKEEEAKRKAEDEQQAKEEREMGKKPWERVRERLPAIKTSEAHKPEKMGQGHPAVRMKTHPEVSQSYPPDKVLPPIEKEELISENDRSLLESMSQDLMTATLPMDRLRRLVPKDHDSIVESYPIMSNYRKNNMLPDVRKFKRKMNTDTSMLHSRIEQYFGVHVPLSSYTIPKSPKPFKHRLLKAISHEDFRLPDIPPEIE